MEVAMREGHREGRNKCISEMRRGSPKKGTTLVSFPGPNATEPYT